MPGEIIESTISSSGGYKVVELRCQSDGKLEQYNLEEGLKGWEFEIPTNTQTGCVPGYYLAVVSEGRLLLFLGSNSRPIYRAILSESNI